MRAELKCRPNNNLGNLQVISYATAYTYKNDDQTIDKASMI